MNRFRKLQELIPPRSQFWVVTFQGYSFWSYSDDRVISIEEGLQLSRCNFFGTVSETMVDAFGRYFVQDVERCDYAIIAFANDQSDWHIGSDQDEQLWRKTDNFIAAIDLLRIVSGTRYTRFAGHTTGDFYMNRVTKTSRGKSGMTWPMRIFTSARIQQAIDVSFALRKLQTDPESSRVLKGINCLLRIPYEGSLNERLFLAYRALEPLINTPRGGSLRVLKERLRSVFSQRQMAEEFSNKIFEARSAIAHAREVESGVFDDHDGENWSDMRATLDLAVVLTSNIYVDILENNWGHHFHDKSSIDNFWSQVSSSKLRVTPCQGLAYEEDSCKAELAQATSM